MKKSIKRLIISAGIIAGLIIISSMLFMMKMRGEIEKMSPLDTRKVVDDVYSVRDDFANLFLVKGNDKFIAFDAGTDGKTVLLEMKKIGIDPENVIALFLTHTDGDHAAAARIFSRARVYISREEEQMVNGKRTRFMFFKNKLPGGYAMASDREIINLTGIKIECVSMPGHTPGSMSFIVNDKYIFTGDSLSLINGRVELFNEFFNMDSPRAAESIKKLAGLSDGKTIFTAHYGYAAPNKAAFGKWK